MLDMNVYHADSLASRPLTIAMSSQASDTEIFYARSPYAGAFDIGYPQENLEGEMYKYRCRSCKKLTTEINGRLENHGEDCEYRIARERESAPK